MTIENLIKFPSKLIIPGGQVPKGRVKVSGAKNSGTRLLAAASLTDERVVLSNFPTKLVDAQHKLRFLANIGFDVQVDYDLEEVQLLGGSIHYDKLPDFGYPIRTTYLLAAAQLCRSGIARIPYPGGCKIGSRGYDLHILVWEKLGCTVSEQPEYIEIKGNLTGGVIDFPKSTVGGTENALLCASVASGKTIIHNAYITPEVTDLVSMLRRMGADITIVGNSYIEVNGKGGLLTGTRMPVMPDRIEALTWIVIGILTGGEILIEDVPFEHMEIPLIHLKEAGINIFRNDNSIYVNQNCLKDGGIQPFELACGTHPGVISDMQPFYVLLALQASGKSRIYDYRYPKRIGYVDELSKFFPKSYSAEEGCITVDGNKAGYAAVAESTDLRGSMAVMMAALLVDGMSTINDAHMALRGYNDLLSKFKSLGINVEEVYE
ncbi:MAG: UDP-N-acetylglucosamine 1-carboxyvinyltransferase [Saccharospirillaceae bacterium]|nr:UDP-N-acetylglucosamine 1-carboxyvinyltransferase [Thalassolituus sp. HI0120]MCH2041653.1 UDP-N-acetylglucosamine 1-carboxyvinyltransferase [Saccharospirillaceae bacterium]